MHPRPPLLGGPGGGGQPEAGPRVAAGARCPCLLVERTEIVRVSGVTEKELRFSSVWSP